MNELSYTLQPDTLFPVTGEAGDVTCVTESEQFAAWLERMDPRFRIRGIHVQAVDRRRDGRLLFAKLRADVVDEHGRRVPGAVFLRGNAVAVLVVLNDGKEKHTVLTVQPRFPAGLYESVEIPAGMCDDHGDLVGVAAREVEEETGISLTHDRLCYLGEFHPSCGGTDECVTLYACEVTVTPEDLDDMHGREHGHEDEHERIHLRIERLENLPRVTTDPKALLAWMWYCRGAQAL